MFFQSYEGERNEGGERHGKGLAEEMCMMDTIPMESEMGR